ncbi:hypothetical protein D6D23_07416 [Aureobasidium pullulans]|nr:hypothetical protein D6D23_07416 [Aureobasidium pullulans]
MPQLARGLSLTPAIRYFQITSRRKSRESCFRLRVLLTSEPKSCRNSREDYLLLELFAACEPDYAATRVGTVLSYGHILLPNHIAPQLEQGPSHTRVASGSLVSTFGDFHTPSQGSAMEFLNAGSTAEGSSTKRSSLSPVKPGPVFSTDTDTDPNTSETRFVCFDLIPEQWTQDSAEGCVLNRALEYTGLIGLIDTAVGSPSEVPGFTLFETVLTTVAFNFISHHEYFGADHTKVTPCLICPPRWSVRIATGLIGLLDLMASPSNGSQPSTPSAEHNPWTFGSAMNAADFGECFNYDMFIRCLGSLRERNARFRGRRRRRDTGFFES